VTLIVEPQTSRPSPKIGLTPSSRASTTVDVDFWEWLDYLSYGLRTEEKGKRMLQYVGAGGIREKSIDDIDRVA
jgi:hypothetical protein